MDKFIVTRKRPAPAKADADSVSTTTTTTTTASKKARTGGASSSSSSSPSSSADDTDYPLSVHAAWLFDKLPAHWKPLLREACAHYTFDHAAQFLRCEIGHGRVFYPPIHQVFEALRRCRVATTSQSDGGGARLDTDVADVAVVILGQDPYIHERQAHGMSFSVQPGTPTPPSLVNVFAEIRNDLAALTRPIDFAPTTGCLVGWARQGVLLLNTCLTVEAGHPGSHRDRGWEPFTDAVISLVSKRSPHPVVFMLWGRDAQSKRKLIDQNRHKILEAAHPSPKSATNGFFGCRHFSQANAFLAKNRRPRIDWTDLSLDPTPAEVINQATRSAGGLTNLAARAYKGDIVAANVPDEMRLLLASQAVAVGSHPQATPEQRDRVVPAAAVLGVSAEGNLAKDHKALCNAAADAVCRHYAPSSRAHDNDGPA
ncbi:Uracil-DNA glycosylase domain containing protein [Pandoravirus celtis]|uniref:Uracil-DNA glycosylase domain containing protein n=1 Tax=Pandoravirus celtis TaxID=2568002 RepID=A0A4D6EIH3_9VIRU|nr:Uracil-DNA glycosylase domain containing protein [Pandoravirus celtis]